MAKDGRFGALVAVHIDRSATVPVYEQIIDALRRAVVSGALSPGTRLPSTRTLAAELNVSRNTALHVFETMIAEGYFEARTGDGTYVTRQIPSCVSEPSPQPAISDARTPYPFRRLSRRGRDLIEQSFGSLPERPVPFMPDVPDVRAFPIRTWLRLMNEVSGRLTGEILVHVSNAGYEPLREAIAHHLRAARGVSCDQSQIIITTGSQQSLDLVSRLLVERGDPVWIEEPGYIGARATLFANGCQVMPVPVDSSGFDLQFARANFPSPRLIYVSPSRQYPLGVPMASERRAELLAFIRRSGSWLIEDDYDHEFRYGGDALPALQAADTDGRVILIGTFSKALLPSFRLGYIVAPADLASDFARARAVIDRHAPLLEQMVLAEFMHRGLYAAHLRRMRVLYRERLEAMLDMLARDCGFRPAAGHTSGGMHVVMPLRGDCDDQALTRELWMNGTVARPLSIYFAGRSRRPGLLLGFAAYTPHEIARVGPILAKTCAGKLNAPV
ncbi:MAG: PLP-dependent aminotransferase family protein [Acetobacteraceae bacterium]